MTLATGLLITLFCSVLLICSSSNSSQGREAYVSLLYGNSYVLPLRVMMLSLKLNSPDVRQGLRERIVLVTGSTSPATLRQLQYDGIKILPVPTLDSPYTQNSKFNERFTSVMTKLTIFNLTSYSRLVFLDADALVTNDLSPLFSCGHFCVAFINPCYFNTGLMVVSPNTTTFSDMHRALPSLPSYDGGDQGFLNSYYPSLIYAPLFDPANPPASPPPLSRLTFPWHTDHSSFYPTFSWAFESSTSCGSHRFIEWLGPPIMKPWLWHTYTVLDLSWTWNNYRRLLHDPYPPGSGTRLKAVILLFASYAILATLNRLFSARRTRNKYIFQYLFRRYPFQRASIWRRSLYPVIIGSVLWVISFYTCVILMPSILPPYPASFVFFHLRMTTSALILSFVAVLGCLGQKERRIHWGGKSLRRIWRTVVLWSIADAGALILFVALLWKKRFSSMWVKTSVVIMGIIGQILFVPCMMSNVVSTALQLMDGSDSLEPG